MRLDDFDENDKLDVNPFNLNFEMGQSEINELREAFETLAD